MPDNHITIRGVKPSDAEALCTIQTQPSSLRFLLQLPSYGVAHYGSIITENRANQHILIAQHLDIVAGFIGLEVLSNPKMRHTGTFWMAVKEEFQHQRVGKRLMKAMIDLADNYLNLHRIEAGVLEDNANANKLYAQFGFSLEGIKKDCVFREGKYIDCAVIARLNPKHK